MLAVALAMVGAGIMLKAEQFILMLIHGSSSEGVTTDVCLC